MRMSIAFAALALSVICVLNGALAAEGVAEPVTLTLRASVTLRGPDFQLADIVEETPGQAPGLPVVALGRAPRAGSTLHLRRDDISVQLHRQGMNAPIRWQGAPAVAMTTLTQRVDPGLLRMAALAQLQAMFSEPDDFFTINLPDAAIELPQRAFTIHPRPVAMSGNARTVIWLDLMVDGAVYRSVVIPATVTRERSGWVALRSLDAGVRVDPADFEQRRVNIAGLDAVLDASLPPGSRLAGPLHPGQVLTRQVVAPAGSVFRGDPVQLTVAEGPLSVNAPGVAQARALPGQMVAVRSSSSGEMLLGRVNHAGNVVIE